MPRPRVLIVEDDPVARGALSYILQVLGCDVRAEADLAGGMAAVADGPYAAIAADVMLPGDGGNGIDLVREAVRLGSAAVVVVMTGARDPALLDDARQLCGGRLLIKPLNPTELLDAMGLWPAAGGRQ